MSSSCDERREYQRHTTYLPDRIGIDGNRISGIGYHRYGLDSPEKYIPDRTGVQETGTEIEIPEWTKADQERLFLKPKNLTIFPCEQCGKHPIIFHKYRFLYFDYRLSCPHFQTKWGYQHKTVIAWNTFVMAVQQGKNPTEIRQMANQIVRESRMGGIHENEKENKIMAKAKKTETTAMVELQGLNESQIAIVTQSTPRHLIKQRKGRAGKVFDYLPHAEVAKILNGAFNHAWDWKVEPILEMCNGNEVTVRGKLTIHGPNGQKIVKEQFGSMDIPHNSQGKPAMSFGDALKGASSDSLKKAASLLGIALDLYGNGHRYQEPVTPEPKKTEPKEPDKPEGITDKQKDFIKKLIKSHVFTTEEKEKAISFCENPETTKEKAVKFIDSLQSHIKTRKESEKETLLQEVMKFRDADPENFGIAMADFKAAYNTESATTVDQLNHILSFQNGNGNQQAAAA